MDTRDDYSMDMEFTKETKNQIQYNADILTN